MEKRPKMTFRIVDDQPVYMRIPAAELNRPISPEAEAIIRAGLLRSLREGGYKG
jgi:hypothetical protein